MLHSFFENHFLLCRIGFACCSLLTQVASGRRCLTRAVENHFPPGAKRDNPQNPQRCFSSIKRHGCGKIPKVPQPHFVVPVTAPEAKDLAAPDLDVVPAVLWGGGGDGPHRDTVAIGPRGQAAPPAVPASARHCGPHRHRAVHGHRHPFWWPPTAMEAAQAACTSEVSSAGRTSPNRPRTPSSQRRAQAQVAQGKDATSSVTRLDGQSDGGSTPSCSSEGQWPLDRTSTGNTCHVGPIYQGDSSHISSLNRQLCTQMQSTGTAVLMRFPKAV